MHLYSTLFTLIPLKKKEIQRNQFDLINLSVNMDVWKTSSGQNLLAYIHVHVKN